MFQFDEDWDPREEEAEKDNGGQRQYRGKGKEAEGGQKQQQQKQKQQRIGERGEEDGEYLHQEEEEEKDDYFALEADKMMSSAPLPADALFPSSADDDHHHQFLLPLPSSGGGHPSSLPPPNVPRFLEHPRSDFVVRSRPAQLSCRAANAHQIRVKCNAKWLDQSRLRLDKGLEATTGERTLRAQTEIQRAELDAWLADLGEFACQCWAFGGEGNGTSSSSKKDNKNNGSSDEEEEEEGEEDEAEERMTASTSTAAVAEQAVRSETARIRLAYLRKHFLQVPMAQRVPEGSTVQLLCQPPDGDPRPEVFWHKDGRQLDFQNGEEDGQGSRPDNAAANAPRNMIQASDGSLILSSARLTDSGNYSCEARNPANRRFTEPAEIRVYVDGGWSPWSGWEGQCPSSPIALDCPVLRSQLAMVRGDAAAVQRVLPRQRRTRACNNPAPLNGGNSCQGEREQFRECAHGCPLDGAWTGWAEWARDCDQQCRRGRQRECAAPAPANGGQECVGPAWQWQNCSAADGPVPAHCLPPAVGGHHSSSANSLPSPHSGAAASGGRPLVDSGLLALVSLASVAFLLAVIVLLVGLLFCAKRKRVRGKKVGGGEGGGVQGHCGAGIFLDKEEKLYFPGAAVAATAEDALGNLRTVLLSADGKQTLVDLDSLGGPSPAHFGGTGLGRYFSLKPSPAAGGPQQQGTPLLGLHPTLSSPSARLASALFQQPHSPQQQSYTLRSWNGTQQQTAVVQPYATGALIGAGGGRRRTPGPQDSAGSRTALLPEYNTSSSSQGSNRTNRTANGGRHPSPSLHHFRHRLNRPAQEEHGPEEEENNYATLYEDFGADVGAVAACRGRDASTESMVDSTYALSSQGSSSAGTRPIGGAEDNGNGQQRQRGEEIRRGPPTFIAAHVDQHSARIQLPQSGAALTIGEGTFSPSAGTLFLSVSDSLEDAGTGRPQLGAGESWLSSAITFGGLCPTAAAGGSTCRRSPSSSAGGLQLCRPVILSTDHCACLFPREHSWLFSVWARLDPLLLEEKREEVEKMEWTRVWDEEADRAESQQQFTVHIDRQSWHLMTQRTGKFMLTGRQRRPHVAAQKRVHLFAFWTPPTANSQHLANSNYDPVPLASACSPGGCGSGTMLELAQLRIYCVPETGMAVESVRQQERHRMGGQLLAEADNFLLQPRGALCCCLEQIAFPGAQQHAHPTAGSQYLEIPDQLHQWCAQNGLHFQLSVLGHCLGSGPVQLPRALCGRLVLYQKGNSSTERQVLAFAVDSTSTAMMLPRDHYSSLSSRLSCDAHNHNGNGQQSFQLSQLVRAELAALLDTQHDSDWRALAHKLALERQIPFLNSLSPRCSAALSLLDLWEALNAGSDERALLDLLQSLRVLGRPDAVQLLELFLSGQQKRVQQQKGHFPHQPPPPAYFLEQAKQSPFGTAEE